MTINLDQYTNTLSVTDTATNADLTFVPKGTGVTKTNGGLAIQSGTGSFPSTGFGLELFNGDSGNNWIQSFNRTSSTYLTTLYNASSHQFRTSGTEQFRVSNTASAVNYLQVTGAATGGNVQISAQGSDSSTGISLVSKGGGGSVWKGDGGVYFQNNAANNLFSVENTSSTVNRLTATGSVTGSGPRLFAQGSDTNIDLTLTPKGTGNVQFGTHTATADTAISGYITIKDSGGTVRKLAVIT